MKRMDFASYFQLAPSSTKKPTRMLNQLMESFLLIKTQLLSTFCFFKKSFLLAKCSIPLLLKFLQAKKVSFTKHTQLIHFIFNTQKKYLQHLRKHQIFCSELFDGCILLVKLYEVVAYFLKIFLNPWKCGSWIENSYEYRKESLHRNEPFNHFHSIQLTNTRGSYG